jgi:RHS repeat-associated protein
MSFQDQNRKWPEERSWNRTKYRYDAFNRRVQKKVETGDISGDQVSRFVYDGWRAIEERGLVGAFPNQTEAVRARYGFGNGLDELIWMDRDMFGSTTTADGSIDARFYVGQDALGNAAVATRERDHPQDSLVTAERYTYSSYGAVTTWGGSDWDGASYSSPAGTSRIGLPYLYTGQRQDPETRNYYYKNRYFDPVMGRFLSRDPLAMGAGPNLYQYASSLPSTSSDLLGLLDDATRRAQAGLSSHVVGDVFSPRTERDNAGTGVSALSAAYASQSQYGQDLARKAVEDPSSLTDDERQDLKKLALAGALSPTATVSLRVSYHELQARVMFVSAGFVETPVAVDDPSVNDSGGTELTEVFTVVQDLVTDGTEAIGDTAYRLAGDLSDPSNQMRAAGFCLVCMGVATGQVEASVYGAGLMTTGQWGHFAGTLTKAAVTPSAENKRAAALELAEDLALGRAATMLGSATGNEALADTSTELAADPLEEGLRALFGNLTVGAAAASAPPAAAAARGSNELSLSWSFQ